MNSIKELITNETLRKYSTLRLEDATMRITQIRVRPSIDVEWVENSQEWLEHFLEKYHKTGQRYSKAYPSEDRLTRVTQIYWIDRAHWAMANKTDPVVIKNTTETNAYYASVGVIQTKILEQKIHGDWYASIKTNVSDEGNLNILDAGDGSNWNRFSLGDMILHNPTLLGNVNKKPPLLK